MKHLSDIINYATAPLVQWEPAIEDAPSEGKQHEDFLTHGAVGGVLGCIGARNITGIIADEARMEIQAAWMLPQAREITHLTLQGAFEKVARNNLKRAQTAGITRADLVRVTTNADSIRPKSQDAVVANMILGCLATAQDHSNLHKMLTFVATLLKPDGKLIVVRPNPAGGEFSTYKCTTPSCDLKGGEDYDFIVRGLEDLGEMKNLYTPDDFMKLQMDSAGLEFSATVPVRDDRGGSQKAPFLMNICSLKR